MPAIAIIGAQWGDEGKGKIVDLLSEKAKLIARFSGGSNAGHTVVNPLGTFKLHLIPSGIFNPDATCLIGNGVVVDPQVLLDELEMLQQSGVARANIFVSDRAHLIMPYHILLDEFEEKARGTQAIGTTRKGIGPAYMDKAARLGIRVGDLLDKEEFKVRLRPVLDYKNNIITKVFDAAPLSFDDVYNQYCMYGERMKPLICDTVIMIHEALDKGDLIILEGAQGAMLDLDLGSYPYVTSSSPMAGGACVGLGLNPKSINHVLGIFKAYTTRVGSGPMPTELEDETGNFIREKAHEYGTTTGRPRRCGWFDAVVARFSSQVNGFTSVALTRLDILDDLPSIKICTAYKVGDTTYTHPPANLNVFEKCQPVYEEMPGWKRDTSNLRLYKDLPKQARTYLRRIEELIGCPISIISVGPSREQTITALPIL